MEPLIHLDARLNLVAGFVPQGSLAADIGTDHAYLPLFLVQSGRCQRVIACDLRQGPLQTARRNVQQAGLEGKIELRLADGLDGVLPGEADCVIMAGIGGILTVQIMQRAQWLKSPGVTLVLQPMTDAALVREWLAEEGFALLDEHAALAGGHSYSAMLWRYDGQRRTPDELWCHTGLLPRGAKAEKIRLEAVHKQLAVKAEGLKQSGREPQRSKELFALCRQIEELMAAIDDKGEG